MDCHWWAPRWHTRFDHDRAVGRRRRTSPGFKDTEPPELVHAIRVVSAGEALLSPRVTRRLIADIAGRRQPGSTHFVLDPLTEREREVLAIAGSGLSNQDIASSLHLSPLTAKNHVARIMTKLNAHDRAQLVIAVYESGLVTPGQR
jgi:DNA-binding NarL/FixJ family response regulator